MYCLLAFCFFLDIIFRGLFIFVVSFYPYWKYWAFWICSLHIECVSVILFLYFSVYFPAKHTIVSYYWLLSILWKILLLWIVQKEKMQHSITLIYLQFLYIKHFLLKIACMVKFRYKQSLYFYSLLFFM